MVFKIYSILSMFHMKHIEVYRDEYSIPDLLE